MKARLLFLAPLAVGLAAALPAAAQQTLPDFVARSQRQPELARRISKVGVEAAYRAWRMQMEETAPLRMHRSDAAGTEAPATADSAWTDFASLSRNRAELARRVSKVGIIPAYREWIAQGRR